MMQATIIEQVIQMVSLIEYVDICFLDAEEIHYDLTALEEKGLEARRK